MAEAPHDATTGRGEALPAENVFGHTCKVLLLREACAGARAGRRGIRILDLGCGSGYAVTRFLGASDDEVLGLDLYAPNVQYAKEHFERQGLTFECRSATSLAQSRQRFDVVVLADVLEHLDDPAVVLKECRRLLAADGMLLLTIPNGYGPFEIESAVARVPLLGWFLLKVAAFVAHVFNRCGPLRGRWTEVLARTPADLPYNAESGHVQFFSRRAIQQQLIAAGFRVLESRNLSFLSGPFTNTIFCVSGVFCRWNVAVARRLPPRLVSGWFFRCAPG